VVSFTPWGKSSQYPWDRRLGSTQSWSGHSSEGKKMPAPAGNQTPVVQPIAKLLY